MLEFTEDNVCDKIYEILIHDYGYRELKDISINEVCDVDLSGFGIDSLTYVELFLELEKYFNIKIEDTAIFKFCSSSTPTINKITNFVLTNGKLFN